MARKPTHDEKRKKKLAERRKKTASTDAVMPYEGNKYREARFTPILFDAECSIREVDVLSGEELTDAQVKASLEYFVLRLRGEEPEIPEGAMVVGEDDHLRDYLSERIQDHWDELQPKLDFLPARADLGGVLRAIISTLNTHTRKTPGGRGYLVFLGPFLEKAGFQVEPPGDEDHIEAGDDLWKAGHTWIMHGDASARAEFIRLAEQGATEGHIADVAHVIEHLEHHAEDPALARDLQRIRLRISAASAPTPEAVPPA